MATNNSYLETFLAFRSHINYDKMFPTAVSKLSSEVNLASVKSCLVFGPGEGDREVQFIKQCTANVSKLIAVEPDHESAERLRARLANSLTDVDSQVIETNIQSWKGLDDQNQVDLVLMMQVLYYVKPDERKKISKKLHEQWLATGGRVVVVSASRTKCLQDFNQIYGRLGKTIVAWEDIEVDLLDAGFIKQYAHEIQCTISLSNPDESFLNWFKCHTDQPVTIDDASNVLKEMFPDGKSDHIFYTFAVFQKA